MSKLRLSILLVSSIFLFAVVVPAKAAGDVSAQNSYVGMCIHAAEMPVGIGESDLKGNPKLESYCQCFSEKFIDRMKKIDPSSRPPVEQSQREEFEMRKSCRASLGLPAPVHKS
jgi:hypothetical protein